MSDTPRQIIVETLREALIQKHQETTNLLESVKFAAGTNPSPRMQKQHDELVTLQDDLLAFLNDDELWDLIDPADAGN